MPDRDLSRQLCELKNERKLGPLPIISVIFMLLKNSYDYDLYDLIIVKNLASFNGQKIKSLKARLKFTGINLWYDGSLW